MKKREKKAFPFVKGDRLTLAITDLADTGEGIGRESGFTFFVKDALPGDEAEVTVMKVRSHFGYAHLDRILRPSGERQEAPCSASRICGGCQLQAWSYEAELAWKENRVRQALIRIGGFDPSYMEQVMQPAAGAAREIYRYRNKAQLPVAADRDGLPTAGYYAARSHRVIPVEDCLLGDPVFGKIRQIVLAHMENLQIPPYDEGTGDGILRHILIRRGYHSGLIGVTLVVNTKENAGKWLRSDPDRVFPGATRLADRLFGEIPGMSALSLNRNAARSNVILGRELMAVRGDPAIEDTMCGLRFRISPLSFYQVNTAQAERLYANVMEFAALTGRETVIDLFCGIGTMSLLAARNAARVIGVEIVPEAVEDAGRNAALNGIRNASFRAGPAEEVLPALLKEGMRVDVLIVDPPRAGLDPSSIDAIRALSPARIVYVSCNPATLARDLKLLTIDTWHLTAVKPFDLFSRTCHVETIALIGQNTDQSH